MLYDQVNLFKLQTNKCLTLEKSDNICIQTDGLELAIGNVASNGGRALFETKCLLENYSEEFFSESEGVYTYTNLTVDIIHICVCFCVRIERSCKINFLFVENRILYKRSHLN